MNKNKLFSLVACVVFAFPSVTRPEVVIRLGNTPIWETSFSSLFKGIAATAAVWGAYAAKQWWNYRTVKKEIDELCKVSDYYSYNQNNPFWVIRTSNGELESVDVIRTNQVLPQKIQTFIGGGEQNQSKLKQAVDQVSQQRKNLEQSSWFLKRLRAQVIAASNVDLSKDLQQDQISRFTNQWHQTIQTPLFEWCGNASRLRNFCTIGCRIMRKLCNPCFTSVANKWIELWNIEQRLLTLQARIQQDNTKKDKVI